MATNSFRTKNTPMAQVPPQSDPISFLPELFSGQLAISSKQSNPTTWGPLPPDVWVIVADQFDDIGDVFRIGRLNKSFFSLTLFDRAALDESCRPIWSKSMLTIAIQKHMDIEYIKTVLRGYKKGQMAAEHLARKYRSTRCTWGNDTEYEPALHTAARYGRIDVVEELLKHGMDIHRRWHNIVQWDFRCELHMFPSPGCLRSRNALCVSRHAGQIEISEFLRSRGVEIISGTEEHTSRCIFLGAESQSL
ncbi:hypothetical protein GGR57DRAFT_204300 [Xylariaceae sp. FL1272]|nr:hypothetical protein GGR57DRAFT_204300 [Xylariaceae sp. FL1272]